MPKLAPCYCTAVEKDAITITEVLLNFFMVVRANFIALFRLKERTALGDTLQ